MRKVALITGASSGIGKETALLFASFGYDVILHYCRHKEEAFMLSSQIEDDYGVKVLCLKADLSSSKEIKKMIDDIDHYFHRLDVVVNNAGISMDSVIEDKTQEVFRKVLDVNLIGVFLVSKYASLIMKNGSIVNVSSTNGIDSFYPYSMEYDASKAGINVLTKDLAIEFGPSIRVNAVAPGWVDTPMNSNLDVDFKNNEEKKIVLGRFATAREIANIIYFLSSDKASYINGSVIVADGGRR